MSLKTEAIKRFLTAARSLANQGMSKEAIMNFAKNEFGQITELFQKQIDSIFKRPASGIEKIKIKDEVFDDTVIKLPMDDTNQPFNPNNPLKRYGKQKQNRPDVYGIDDYDTTNMSETKKQLIKTETKLGNLNPDSPDFKERAKVLIDEIEDLKNKLDDLDLRTDKYTGGRAGYAVGNQVTPQVDARMNLDYNTLLDQNEAQRGFMQNWRDHAQLAQTMRGKSIGAGLKPGETIPEYGMQSGYDFQKKFNFNPKVSAGLGLGYQALTEGLGMFNPKNPNFLNPFKTGETIYGDYKKNVEGILAAESNNLTAEQQANRNKFLASQGQPIEPKVDPDRILDILSQQKEAGVPEEGLITQLYKNATQDKNKQNDPNRPTMADVAGPSKAAPQEGGGYAGNTKNVASKDPLGLIQKINKLRNGQTPTANYSYQPEEGGYVAWDGSSYTVVSPEQIKMDIEDLERSDKKKFAQGLFAANEVDAKTGNRIYDIDSLYDQYQQAPGAGFFSLPEMYQRFKSFYAGGGRAGHYTGGMVDVEPNLSDIGHGSDALMARTRLMSPGSQATTSTGLNYLLAEDNDNIRIPFSKGKIAKELLDKGRRGFMKAAGGIGAGIAGLKSGLLGFGDQAAPVAEKVVETVSETAQGVPPYFLNLVKKIKNLGARSDGYKERSESFRYKDYDMDIDYDTGVIEIKKTKEAMIPGSDEAGVSEEVYMTYKPGMADETTRGKPADEYEEFTARPDMDGKMKDVEEGVPDEVIEEGTMFEDNITDFKKAEGGRIGYSKGNLIKTLGSRTLAFLEKVFGKEAMAEMPRRDPEMYKGLLEVAEAFRARDKEGLKMYMQKYLPHMDDTEIEEFIIGSDGTEGLQGQLIRLGSGRDYKAKMDLLEEANKNRKLSNLEVTEEMKRKPNASGGLAKLLGE